MDEELKAYLDSMRAENAAAHVETRRYAEQLISETRMDFGAVWERFESKIELVAEGVLGANERIDRLEDKVDDLADEMRTGFADVRSMITLSHTQLDTRVRKLEQH